jgi:branched-chain amino acid transport system permease protein
VIAQYVADGVVLGATLALGAIGLTLTYNILRFANFAHGEFLAFGAYFALVITGAFAGARAVGSLSVGAGFLAAIVPAIALTALLALALDWALFASLRRRGAAVALVMASFGASLMLRNLIVFVWGPQPRYYSRTIAMAHPIMPGVRLSTDDLFAVVLTALLMLALHLFLERTALGRQMRAVSDDPSLAQISGVNLRRVVGWTLCIGGGLAAAAGMMFGLTVQVSPVMGFNLILPLFAAAILGGIGSVYGAVLGAMVIGLAESLSVPLIGAAYKPAVAFALMLIMLLARPQGLLGDRT